MTNLCTGGGTSSPKPGVATVIEFLLNIIGFASIPTNLLWIVPFLAYIGQKTYTSATLCATDPPGFPTFTTAEAVAFTTFQIATPDWLSCLVKLNQCVDTIVWFAYCKCDAGTQPTQPTPPPPPAGTPTVQPPPVAPTTYCKLAVSSFGQHPVLTPVVLTYTGELDSANVAIPVNATTVSWFPLVDTQDQVNTAQWETTLTILAADKTTVLASQLIRCWSPHPWTVQELIYSLGTTTGIVIPVPFPLTGNNVLVPAGGAFVHTVTTNTAAVASNDSVGTYLYFYCNGVTPGQSICCPTDPTVLNLLNQISTMVTLIQRAEVPFAYLKGTVHAGLSGHGSFNIQGLLGIEIQVTTLPPTYEVRFSQPQEIFDAGFLTFFTPDGYPHSSRAEHFQQLILPARASAFTEFAYDLMPGVIITATEILREP